MKSVKFRYYFPVLIWALLIMAVSSIPNLKTPAEGIVFSDKAAHFAEYFVFGLLAADMLWKINKNNRYIILITIIMGTTYGILDELHQLFIPGRKTDVFDMTSDALGAILASLIYVWWRSRRSVRVPASQS
jgi:VanZ family protein